MCHMVQIRPKIIKDRGDGFVHQKNRHGHATKCGQRMSGINSVDSRPKMVNIGLSNHTLVPSATPPARTRA